MRMVRPAMRPLEKLQRPGRILLWCKLHWWPDRWHPNWPGRRTAPNVTERNGNNMCSMPCVTRQFDDSNLVEHDGISTVIDTACCRAPEALTTPLTLYSDVASNYACNLNQRVEMRTPVSSRQGRDAQESHCDLKSCHNCHTLSHPNSV